MRCAQQWSDLLGISPLALKRSNSERERFTLQSRRILQISVDCGWSANFFNTSSILSKRFWIPASTLLVTFSGRTFDSISGNPAVRRAFATSLSATSWEVGCDPAKSWPKASPGKWAREQRGRRSKDRETRLIHLVGLQFFSYQHKIFPGQQWRTFIDENEKNPWFTIAHLQ